MPKGNLKTDQLSIIEMIVQWESSDSDSRSKLWALGWRIGALDPDKKRSTIRKEWVARAQVGNQDTLQRVVNGCAAIGRLTGGKLPNVQQRNRIEKNGPSTVGEKSARLNADILTKKGSNVKDCLDPAKKRSKSTPELISGEAPTVENIGMLLGQCIIAATDSDPVQLCENVITIAMAYVADAKEKAKN